MLNKITHGTITDKPGLLIVHGLFGSARNWGVIAKRLATDRQVITVDMRNHGDSFHSDTMTYTDMAADLAAVLEGKCDVLGHSMGGKAAMVLALHNRDLVGRLIVADIAPVAYSHTQTALIDAMEAVDPSVITRRSEADRLLSEHIEAREIRAFLLQSLDIKARKWRYNLRALRGYMPDIIGFPEISGVFDGPTLFVSGARSDYVTHAHRAVIKPLFPQARFTKILEAGHWLHADKPRAFEATVRAFLDQRV